MITSPRHPKVYVALTALAIASTLGCKVPTFSETKHPTLAKVNRHLPWYDADEPHIGMPERMMGNWTDTVLYKEGQKPQRGLGGRVLFFAEGSDKPILVEGQMVVYAFDESNRNPTDNSPTRRYVFPADQLPPRMSKSDLGPSYNFFLPWDELGGPQTDVSLMCRFEPKGGPVVVGEQTRHRLPGTTPTEIAGTSTPPKLPDGVPYRPAVEQGFKLPGKTADAAVRPASFDGAGLNAAEIPLPQAAEGHMNSTLIPLPESMQHSGQGASVHNNRGASQQPAVTPTQIPTGGQSSAIPANATSRYVPPQTNSLNPQNGAPMVPTTQAGVAMNTPNAAAEARAGGYRLVPQQAPILTPTVPAAATRSTYPPTNVVQADAAGNVSGAATGNQPPAGLQGLVPQAGALPAQRVVTLPNGQQVVLPTAPVAMGNGQITPQTITPIGQQQYSMQGWNDHQPYGAPTNQMPAANVAPVANFPTSPMYR